MNRSLEQALLSLLPTHNTDLPQPLTELASSLLAQSRNRASTLKAEEEISRPYACAHIACDRYPPFPSHSPSIHLSNPPTSLKVQLNLPPIEPRPPIPPRIYKRLYNHLDHILPSTTSTPSRTRTPSAKLREATTTPGASPLASKSRLNPSPSKSRLAPSPTKSLLPPTPSKPPTTTPRKPTTTTNPPSDPLPPWIRPTLRHLITTLTPPLPIGLIVISGLESIATPTALASDPWIPSHLTPLLGALYLYVWRAVASPSEDMPASEYVRCRRAVAAALKRARDEVKSVPEAGWEGWEEVKVGDLDAAALRVSRRGWLEMGWAAGVGDLVALGERRAAEREELEEGEGGGERLTAGRRGDSMFQERYDFLGEGRREEYEEWKEGMLRRIEELERAEGEGEAMEVDG